MYRDRLAGARAARSAHLTLQPRAPADRFPRRFNPGSTRPCIRFPPARAGYRRRRRNASRSCSFRATARLRRDLLHEGAQPAADRKDHLGHQWAGGRRHRRQRQLLRDEHEVEHGHRIRARKRHPQLHLLERSRTRPASRWTPSRTSTFESEPRLGESLSAADQHAEPHDNEPSVSDRPRARSLRQPLRTSYTASFQNGEIVEYSPGSGNGTNLGIVTQTPGGIVLDKPAISSPPISDYRRAVFPPGKTAPSETFAQNALDPDPVRFLERRTRSTSATRSETRSTCTRIRAASW